MNTLKLDSEGNPTFDHQRVRLSSDLEALGPAGVQRSTLNIADGVWKGIRAGLWLGGIPWSMMVTGVGGPGHFRIGHRGPLRRLAARALRRSGEVAALQVHDVAALHDVPDGARVKLSGRARLRHRLPSLGPRVEDAIYQRVDFKLVIITGAMTRKLFLTYEAGQDFDIDLGRGADEDLVRVQVSRAVFIPSLLIKRRGGLPVEGAGIQTLPMDPDVGRYLDHAVIHAIRGIKSRLLQDGQKVRVVGAKAKVVDKNLRGRLFRQEPYRLALMDHPEQPVVICQRRP